MNVSVSVPFAVWGGDDCQVFSHSKTLSPTAIAHFVEWSKRLSNIPRYHEFLATGGMSWVNLALPSEDMRLHLKPLVKKNPGSRGLPYFFGVFASRDQSRSIPSFAAFLQAVDKYSVDSLEELTGLDGSIVLGFAPYKAIVADSSVDWRSLEGASQSGAYPELLAWLSERIAVDDPGWFSQLNIACNPPVSHPDLTTLLITHDFYLPGIELSRPALPRSDDNFSQIATEPTREPPTPSQRDVGPAKDDAALSSRPRETLGFGKCLVTILLAIQLVFVLVLAAMIAMAFDVREETRVITTRLNGIDSKLQRVVEDTRRLERKLVDLSNSAARREDVEDLKNRVPSLDREVDSLNKEVETSSTWPRRRTETKREARNPDDTQGIIQEFTP